VLPFLLVQFSQPGGATDRPTPAAGAVMAAFLVGGILLGWLPLAAGAIWWLVLYKLLRFMPVPVQVARVNRIAPGKATALNLVALGFLIMCGFGSWSIYRSETLTGDRKLAEQLIVSEPDYTP